MPFNTAIDTLFAVEDSTLDIGQGSWHGSIPLIARHLDKEIIEKIRYLAIDLSRYEPGYLNSFGMFFFSRKKPYESLLGFKRLETVYVLIKHQALSSRHISSSHLKAASA
jgi:hypothetical protein